MPSKCGHCGSTNWELNLEVPSGSNYKLYFVRCGSCRVPIGVLEYYNSGAEIKKVQDSLSTLGSSLTRTLQIIDENIRRLFRK